MSSVEFWIFVSSLAGRNFLIVASLSLIIYFLYTKKNKPALLVAVSFYGGIVLNKILKEIFQVPRPDNPLIPIEG